VHRESSAWRGVFSSAGAGVKTNLLFFARGGPTERVWYYDLKAVNPNAKSDEDTPTPEELLEIIEARARRSRLRLQLREDR
jgi:type I restriction enzyme M protein